MKGNKYFYEDEHADYFKFDKLLEEKTTIVLLNLGIPVMVDSGFRDKTGKVYSFRDLQKATQNMSIEEESRFFKENQIRHFATKVDSVKELLEAMDPGRMEPDAYLSPDFISSEEATPFTFCFEYMTDPKFGFYTKEECNKIQLEMILQKAPLDLEKVRNVATRYLTEDKIRQAVERTKGAYPRSVDPYEFMKENIQKFLSSEGIRQA